MEAITQAFSFENDFINIDIDENNENAYEIYFQVPKNKKENKKEKKKPKITIKIYSGEDIINTLKDVNGFSQKIINQINDNYITEQDKNNVNHFFTKIKRKRTKKSTNEKANKVKNCVKHTKEDADNIIKKVKSLFFTNVINHINIYIQKEEDKLLYIDYEIINQLRKDFDLDLLGMKLRDLVSLNISKKYKNYQKNWNELIIQNISESEANNDKLMNLLNITFNEWINIFTYKQKSEYNLDINLLQPALERIYEKNKYNKNKDNENKDNKSDETKNVSYFNRFIFYLYNYQRWFQKKRGRNRENTQN